MFGILFTDSARSLAASPTSLRPLRSANDANLRTLLLTSSGVFAILYVG